MIRSVNLKSGKLNIFFFLLLLVLSSFCPLKLTAQEEGKAIRIGGDESAVIMEGSDFNNKDELFRRFNEAEEEISSKAENSWEEVHVAFGIAVHDPKNDDTVNVTARRADKIMYQNKKLGKGKRILE